MSTEGPSGCPRACAGDSSDLESRHPEFPCSRRRFVLTGAAALGGLVLGGRRKARAAEIRFAKDTFPTHRVVRALDRDATHWDWTSNYYFDHADQDRINRMFDEGIRHLVGLTDPKAAVRAWKKLFDSYQAGDRVAIKINCNNSADRSNDIDATSLTLFPVLKGLIEHCKIPAGNIYVYDVARPIGQFRLISRIRASYPEVLFVPSGHALAAQDSSAPVAYRMIATQYLPKVLTGAQHLVNLCLFKNHSLAHATMTLKNHIGTTRPAPGNLHTPLATNLSDINSCEHVREKTRLCVGDALWGIWTGGPGGVPQKWSTFPGETPNSIFLATDPVAHQSVMSDYLLAERKLQGREIRSHDELHDAMDHHGLGIHEHCDSRGRYEKIDYLQIDTSKPGSARIAVH